MVRSVRNLPFVVVLSLFFTACGGSSAPTSPTPQPTPSISVSITPATASVLVGTSIRFSAAVSGPANTAVSYAVMSTPGGQVAAGGVYTAPATPGTVRLRATSLADPSKWAEAVVTVRDYENAVARMQNLNDGYDYHTLTLMQDGTVLVVGGIGYSGLHAQALLYDAGRDVYAADAILTTPRAAHAAARLPDGRVIVMGGYDPHIPGSDLDPVFTSSEIYDPGTRRFSAGPEMTIARRHHVATVLSDGKVLVTGGIQVQGRSVPSIPDAEVYDPVSNRFTAVGPMLEARWMHTATLLKDGRVLVLGGRSNNCGAACPRISLTSAEVFDPATGRFTPAASLHIGRYGHTATLLEDGCVLTTGGENLQVSGNGEDEVAPTEMYDPVTDTFTLGPSLLVPRSSHTATMLNNGKILLAGGFRVDGSGTDRTEIYDTATGQSSEGPLMADFHIRGSAAKLPNGEVLIVAGSTGGGPSAIVDKFR